MKSHFRIILTALLLTAGIQQTASAQYYKDIFVDAGIHMSDYDDFPVARMLGLSWERFTAGEYPDHLTHRDTVIQHQLYEGSELDENGIWLYPDGAPRFRAIYVHGGLATYHGNSMGEAGRDHLRAFVRGGGSYIGSCAGAFLVSLGGTDFDPAKGRCRDDQSDFVNNKYLHLFPGRTLETHLINSYADLILEKDSPLLKYSDFGGSRRIPLVRHSGGCCIVEKAPHFPKGTRPLLRFDFPGDTAADRPYPLTGKIAIWSFRDNDTSGLVIATGSHPESNPQGMIAKGPSLNLFSALIRYALDETGPARIKGELHNGEPMVMDRKTSDNDPAHARIGDKQYHHFTVRISKGARNVKVRLEGGYPKDDLYLTLRKGDFAWAREAQFADCALGCDKTMELNTLTEGLWYVGVHCATTVDVVPTDWGCLYTGHLETLNGIPYTLTVSWE